MSIRRSSNISNYTDAEYNEEIDRIRQRFTPLVNICKEYGTAMRIGTNHGSLSDRIMSRYGDTPIGMVESAMEFLRVARGEAYHNIILSMKSSNPQVMVQAYRLLIRQMDAEFGVCYPLHLGVTEAGDGEDGRIKSAIGIGTLLEDGIGDTIRVSLTEDPEFEIPVCNDLVRRYQQRETAEPPIPPIQKIPYSPFEYRRRVLPLTGQHRRDPCPRRDRGFYESQRSPPARSQSHRLYLRRPQATSGTSAMRRRNYLYTGKKAIDFELPGTLRAVCDHANWLELDQRGKIHPPVPGRGIRSRGRTLGYAEFHCRRHRERGRRRSGGDPARRRYRGALLLQLPPAKHAFRTAVYHGADGSRSPLSRHPCG